MYLRRNVFSRLNNRMMFKQWIENQSPDNDPESVFYRAFDHIRPYGRKPKSNTKVNLGSNIDPNAPTAIHQNGQSSINQNGKSDLSSIIIDKLSQIDARLSEIEKKVTGGNSSNSNNGTNRMQNPFVNGGNGNGNGSFRNIPATGMPSAVSSNGTFNGVK